MTDNEIIKALECCGDKNCKYCPNFSVDIECSEKLIKLSLDLINRQKAENGRLKTRYNDLLASETEQFQKGYNIGSDDAYKRTKSEAIREFAEKIDQLFDRYAHILSHADCARKDYIKTDDGTEIEMQSVWDVFRLEKHGIAEYEEMNRLQENIELIEKGRLLAELKNDFRLLVKEMTESEVKKDG